MDRNRESPVISVKLLQGRAGRLMPFVAIVISVAALLLTGFQIREGIKHNHLLVKPKLELIWALRHPVDGMNGVHLKNTGLGPAQIKDLQIVFDGKPVHDWKFVDQYYANIGLHRPDSRTGTRFPR